MRDVSIGQYYAVNSPIHRLDARIKLILTFAFIVMIFFIDTYFAFGIMIVLLLALILTARIPLKKLLRSLRGILFLLLFTVTLTIIFSAGTAGEVPWAWWIFKIYPSSLISSGLLALRLIVLMLGPTVLTLTTTPVELTDAIERLLKPLSYIKIPVHEFAMIMSIALRLIPTLSEETDKIIAAQKSRCADFESGNLFRRAKAMIPILIPLFVSSFRRADELAYAMDSRCYRGAKGRTRMKVMKFALRDLFAFLLFAAIFFGVLLFKFNYWGFAGLEWFKGIIL